MLLYSGYTAGLLASLHDWQLQGAANRGLVLSCQLSTAGGLVCSSIRFTASRPRDSLLPPLTSMSNGKLQGLDETTGGMCARFSLTLLITSVNSPSS